MNFSHNSSEPKQPSLADQFRSQLKTELSAFLERFEKLCRAAEVCELDRMYRDDV